MYISIALILIGLTLRIISIKHLGNNFSLRLEKPQTIVKTGIYKYVRHPSYVGSLMLISGIFLANQTVGFIYFVFVFFLSRIKQEEQILEFHYPEYQAYKKVTGGLFPKFYKIRKKVK